MSCELDCTSSCRLVDHGNMLTKCLTKREISEDKLISFLLLTCANFNKNLDDHVSKSFRDLHATGVNSSTAMILNREELLFMWLVPHRNRWLRNFF